MKLLVCFVFIVPLQFNLRRMYLTRIKNSIRHFHISSLETSELVAELFFSEIKQFTDGEIAKHLKKEKKFKH